MSSKKVKDPPASKETTTPPPEEGKIAGLRRRLRNAIGKKKEKQDTDDERSTRRKKKDPDATVEEKSKRSSAPSKPKRRTTLRKRNKEATVDQTPSHEAVPPNTPPPVATAAKEPVLPRRKVSLDGKVSQQQPNVVTPPPPPVAPVTPPPTGLKNSKESSQPPPVPHNTAATICDDGGEKTQSCSESIKKSVKVLRRPKKAEDLSKEKDPTYEDHSRKHEVKPHQVSAIGGAGGGELRVPPAVNIKRFFERAIQMGVGKLRVEFLTMKKEKVADPVEHKAFLANPTKNRYHDVFCHESTRIKLVGHIDGNDYIHANYVATEQSPKRFICAQGPNAATVYDFWHMILQEGCQAIVMLCGVVENNSPKCVQYWNEKEGETIAFRDITIKTIQKQQLDAVKGVTLTTLYAKSPTKELTVKHFQMTTWPDKGVPKNPDTIFNLLQCVRPSTKPILVHCSAGIGRTGSFVLIELILDRICKHVAIPEMHELLKLLRKQRANCVQTDMQYLFCHIAIMRYYVRIKLISMDMPGLQKFFDDYEKVFPAGISA